MTKENKFKIKIWDDTDTAVFKAREDTPEELGKAVRDWLKKFR